MYHMIRGLSEMCSSLLRRKRNSPEFNRALIRLKQALEDVAVFF